MRGFFFAAKKQTCRALRRTTTKCALNASRNPTNPPTQEQDEQRQRPYDRPGAAASRGAFQPNHPGVKGAPKQQTPMVDDGQARLRYRIRAIDYGKNTLGYDLYTKAVPRSVRVPLCLFL
jgi:hypothetical protein